MAQKAISKETSNGEEGGGRGRREGGWGVGERLKLFYPEIPPEQ